MKALISLAHGAADFQIGSATSQPRPQETCFRKRLSLSLDNRSHQLKSRVLAQTLPSVDALAHRLASSANALPDDPSTCRVCGAASSRMCLACEEAFCANHLYICADCDNHYCGSCLDEHRADGHWSDSDTTAELNNVQRVCGEAAACRNNLGAISPTPRNQSAAEPSWPATPARFSSLFVSVLRSSCRRVPGSAGATTCCSTILPLEVCS